MKFSSILLVCLMFSIMNGDLLAQGLPSVEAAVRALDRDPDMVSASWSLTVLDAKTGQPLLKHNSDKALVTASTMKMVTTITAFEILGPNFQFQTKLAYEGRITNEGALVGNLHIIGDGDPTFGSDRLGQGRGLNSLMALLSEKIKAAGIKEIQGDIIGDASIFGSQLTPSKWPWEDMGNYYGAGAGGLNVHENYYRLDLVPGSYVGGPTKVLRTVPAMLDLTFFNEISTGRAGSGDNGYIFGAPYTSERYLRGTIPYGPSSFSIKGSISDPAYYTAWRLMEELNGCGVKVYGNVTTNRLMKLQGRSLNKSRKIIYTYKSLPLKEIITATNMKSINVYAEALAKRSAVKNGRKGTTEDAMEMIEDYWKARGVVTKGMYLRDGAGLSPNNALSTYQLARIMYLAGKKYYIGDLKASLPVAGRSGSLKSMLRGTAAEGRLRAKSGYVSGARGYAGYVKTRAGRELIFSIVSNNYACGAGAMRRKLEKVMAKIAE